jgi:hypothetical protein
MRKGRLEGAALFAEGLPALNLKSLFVQQWVTAFAGMNG